MSLNAPPRQPPSTFGNKQERLEYLIDMMRQLQSMASRDYPTVSNHLRTAVDEAMRLSKSRD
jgi:hypothetical protein